MEHHLKRLKYNEEELLSDDEFEIIYDNQSTDPFFINDEKSNSPVPYTPLLDDKVDIMYDSGRKNSFFPNLKNNDNHILKTEIMNGHLENVSALLRIEKSITIINKALHWAVIAKNKSIIKEVLKYNPDLTATDETGRMVLHLAITGDQSHCYRQQPGKRLAALKRPKIDSIEQKNIIEILDLLINSGSDVNAEICTYETPLWLAIVYRMNEVTEFLIKRGADLNIYDCIGDSIVHFLIKELICSKDWLSQINIENLNYLNWILSLGFSINLKDYFGETPFEMSLKKDTWQVFLVLLHHAKDLPPHNEREPTILHRFIEHKRSSIDNDHIVTGMFPNMKHLHELNNEVKHIINLMIKKGVPINAADHNGNTALHLAALYKKMHIMQILLSHSPNIDALNDKNETVLHLILSSNCRLSEEMISILIRKGANINIKDCLGVTPVHIAAKLWNKEILQILEKAGADLSLCTADGSNLLHLAVSNNNRNDGLVEYLVEKGCEVNAKNERGSTPLHVALSYKAHKFDYIFKLQQRNSPPLDDRIPDIISLLFFGADVNCPETSSGNLPIHIAAMQGNIDVIDRLIECGADVKSRTLKMHFTPLHMAVDAMPMFTNSDQWDDLISAFVKKGVDVNSKDNLGRTPLHLAANREKYRVVYLLLKLGAHVDAITNCGWLPSNYALIHNNSMLLNKLLQYGSNVNDIRWTFSLEEIIEETRDEKSVWIDMVKHLIELQTIGLPVACFFQPILNKVGHNFAKYAEECLEEVNLLKNKFSKSGKSWFEIIRMHPYRRFAYVNDGDLKLFSDQSLDNNQGFPRYTGIILSKIRQSLERKLLHEPARIAWYDATKIWLPDICVDKILDYLSNENLRMLIESASENDRENFM